MPHLLLFAIGPVQTFIEQARKTQDLFAGSRILSDLCKTGMNVIEPKYGSIIFPNKNNESVPNRFIAEITNLDGKSMSDIGIEVEDIVRGYFFNRTNLPDWLGKLDKANDIAIDQLANLLEIYWVFENFNDENDYEAAYARIEQEMGAIKNLRAYTQLNQGNGEQGRKCSVDGERNAVIYQREESETGISDTSIINRKFFKIDAIKIISDKEKNNFPLGTVSPGEAISAVTLYKRKYDTGQGEFESVAAIALMHLKKDAELDTLIKNFYAKAGVSEEPQLLFPGNLEKDYLRKNGFSKLIEKPDDQNKEDSKIHGLQSLQNEIARSAKAKKINISPYYAVLVFDADNMGKWMSGDYIKDKKKLKQFQAHLSTLLGVYSDELKKYVDGEQGKTVYSGGDDYLGFLNLSDLFTILYKIRSMLDTEVDKKLCKPGEFEFIPNIKPFSISAGLCIAHYKQPLNMAIREARNMEKKAKNEPDKNTLAVSLVKHSGNMEETILPWSSGSLSVGLMNDIITAIRGEQFSRSFIKNLIDEVNLWGDFPDPDLIKSELARLIRRSVNNKAFNKYENEKKEKAIKTLIENVEGLFALSRNKMQNFISGLNICDFLQRTI